MEGMLQVTVLSAVPRYGKCCERTFTWQAEFIAGWCWMHHIIIPVQSKKFCLSGQ